MSNSLQSSQTSDTLKEWVQLGCSDPDVDDDSIVVKESVDGNEENESQPVVTAPFTEPPTPDQQLLRKAQLDGSAKSIASTSSVKTISASQSGKATPESHTPKWEDDLTICDVLENSERVWDWASRPEMIPPPGYETKMYYPGGRRPGTYYNRYGQKSSLFSWENLPQLLVSHATAFVIGAAAAFAFSRLRSAASYGSVMVAASDAAALGSQTSQSLQQPTLRLDAPSFDSSTRAGFFISDRIF